MKFTTNYNLKKPDANTDLVNIEDLNENFETIDEKLFEALKTLKDFFANGGEIGGAITFPKGITRQISQKIGLRSKDYTQRSGISNYNGYPCWATVIEDPDDDNNTNGLLFMLGSGSGDAYNDNYLRPLKMGYAQKNNIGSATVPWDDIFLRGVYKTSNGYNRLSNGMIIQWGEIVLTGASAQSSNEWPLFPVSFPTQCLIVVGNASPRDNNTNAVPCYFYMDVVDKNKYHYRLGGATQSTTTKIQWMAIGY